MRLNKFKYLNKEQHNALRAKWKELNNDGRLAKIPYYHEYDDAIKLVSNSSYKLHLFYLAITGKDLTSSIGKRTTTTGRLHDEMHKMRGNIIYANSKHFKYFFGDIIPDHVYRDVYNDMVALFTKEKLINYSGRWSNVGSIK